MDVARRMRREAKATRKSLGIEMTPVAKISHKSALRRPRPIVAEGLTWWVARCAPGCAFRVVDDLAASGFTTLAPAARKVVVCRGAKKASARKLVERPVFGSYAFIGASPDRGVFKRTHEKIEEILGDGLRPIPAPWRAVQLLSDLDCAGEWGGLLTLDGGLAPFVRGDLVKFTAGPFAELIGEVKAMRGEARAIIEAVLFGQPTQFTVDACQVARVAL